MGAGMVIGFFAGWVWCRIVFPPRAERAKGAGNDQ